MLKIFLKNNSYKSIKVNREDSAMDLARKMAAKLNMSENDKYFDVIELVKEERMYRKREREEEGGEEGGEVRS